MSDTIIPLPDAQANLANILERLHPGEEILITDHGKPLAAVKKATSAARSCKAGCYRKAESWMSPDFDAPLSDFQEYME